jgi:7-cyano-7-deazaguanine synthase in queuosine biosynthesis
MKGNEAYVEPVIEGAYYRFTVKAGKPKEVDAATHSCYLGERARHDWGHGCGSCPACRLRAEGWRKYIASSEKHGPA